MHFMIGNTLNKLRYQSRSEDEKTHIVKICSKRELPLRSKALIEKIEKAAVVSS